jgi:AcrR family transcriptional regulator
LGDLANSDVEAPLKDGASKPPAAGLLAHHRRRKQDSRVRLLAAASEKFCQQGYFSVSVEDIASAAGVSRMTLYRHFSGKAALTAELFREATEEMVPIYLAICVQDFADRAVVREWIATIFAADFANRTLLRVFKQATADEGGFTEGAQQMIGALIAGLGRAIPAFATSPDRPEERRRWLEAWLLLYEILDQSNHAALRSGVASDPWVIDILTDRVIRFVCPG